MKRLLLAVTAAAACAPTVPSAPTPRVAPLADADVAARIARVEHGLLRGARIQGVPGVALQDRMRAHHVHGLSVAVVDGHRIVWAKAYGLADAEQRTPVEPTTLFLAGSISKPVAATALLRRVEEGKLALDRPIDAALTSWKLPGNPLTRETPVTLAMLLSHTAGLTVHGFPGYAAGDPVPTVPQILDGVLPANTPPVRARDHLASAYARAGDRDRAIAAYRDVLACAARDTALATGAKEALRSKALAKLKDLGAAP